MVFNSLEFALFLIVVLGLYYNLGLRGQNRMLLVASYIFYGMWDWRFLSLIVFTTLLDYVAGLRIGGSADPRTRRRWLVVSMVSNLGILGVFKYLGFFAEAFSDLAALAGWHPDPVTLKLVLPVGISFYTFQSMSYAIDIYRRELEPTRDLLDFGLFVAYFPQLVAGPIERAAALLPQLLRPRTTSLQQVREGLWLILWGLFKKVFVADNLARLVDEVFARGGPGNGAEAVLAVYAFAFQIYGDFSGYSDIARGASKLMGIELMVNFRFPYLVTNPRDFWKHWHISLSSWLRDYLYVPLGGNRGGTFMLYRNLAFTMLLGGLWHGAAWTFVLWGVYQGGLLVGHRLLETTWFRRAPSRFASGAWRALNVLLYFQLTCLGWLIFRADSVSQVARFLEDAVLRFQWTPRVGGMALWVAFFLLPLLLIQALQQRKGGDLEAVLRLPALPRWAIYCALYLLLTLFGEFGGAQFIYFQF